MAATIYYGEDVAKYRGLSKNFAALKRDLIKSVERWQTACAALGKHAVIIPDIRSTK